MKLAITSILCIFTSLVVSQNAFAGSGITYHGRLIDPNGHAVVGNNVQFRIQLRTPGNENCLMYEEIQAKDLSQSDGVFAVTINDGSGVRTDTSGFAIDQIFANRNGFTFGAGQCATGTVYNTSPTDGRRIQVYFNDGVIPSGQWEAMPSMAINFVPMAIEAQQIGGYKKEQLIKVADGVSTSQTEFNTTSWTDLLALIAGTSNKYVKPTDQVTQLYGATVPAPANGQSIRWNTTLNAGAGGWENFTAGASSGTVTSITAGTGLLGGTITTSGTISVDVGTTTGKIVQVAASNKLPAIDASNLTSLTAANISGAVAIANGGTGQITKAAGFDALSPTTTKGDLIVSNGTNNIRLPAGTNNYVLQADSTQAAGVKWSALTDTLSGLSCSSSDVSYWNGAAWACRASASTNTASSLVLRDTFGNFAANDGTLNTLKLDNGSGAQISLITPVAFTSYTLRMPATTGTSGYALTTDGGTPGQLSWTAMPSAAGDIVNGGNTTGATVTVGTNDAQSLALETGGTTKMTILNSGNVGISMSLLLVAFLKMVEIALAETPL